MDILDANLRAGISVQKYVPSYGNAPNDIEHVTKCKKSIHGTDSGFLLMLSLPDFNSQLIRWEQVGGTDQPFWLRPTKNVWCFRNGYLRGNELSSVTRLLQS